MKEALKLEWFCFWISFVFPWRALLSLAEPPPPPPPHLFPWMIGNVHFPSLCHPVDKQHKTITMNVGYFYFL